MARGRLETIHYQVAELAGVRYAIVREAQLLNLGRMTGVNVKAGEHDGAQDRLEELEQWDGPDLTQRLVQRRKGLGLAQAALAARAGIRVETLNRIERGKVTPDFSTIRKLVVALREVEREG